MRTTKTFLLAAGILSLGSLAVAQTPVASIIATGGCGGIMDNDADNAILIGVKIPTTGACTDMLFDLRQTGGLNIGGADVGNASNPLSTLPPNWTNAQVPTDDHIFYVIYPPAAGSRANRMGIDSGTINNQDFTAVAVQTVGNSIPSSYPGTQGIDLNLATTSYSVKLRGPGSTATTGFPRGANGGIEVAFSPLAEVNDTDLIGGGCDVAGETRNPGPSNPDPQVDGGIIGYNVYRVVGTAGTPPTANDFYTQSLDADPSQGFQYFMPLYVSYDLGAADTNPGAPTPPAPNDLRPNDLGGLQNPDGVMYSGDEVMIFQDSAANRGTTRQSGTAPVAGTGYWYAFQPVLCGAMADWAGPRGFSGGGTTLNGDHGSSASALAAGDDTVDLDLNGTPDFFSPQWDVGVTDGLGFMYNALPVFTEFVFGSVNPAAAGGSLVLTGRMDGQNVNLTFQTGLEAGDVQGFNVFRGVGDSRVRVNEQLILAQGTESSVYQLVDDATQARRLSKGGSVQYTVDIVYTDGHTNTVGPFAVTIGGGNAPGRRTR